MYGVTINITAIRDNGSPIQQQFNSIDEATTAVFRWALEYGELLSVYMNVSDRNDPGNETTQWNPDEFVLISVSPKWHDCPLKDAPCYWTAEHQRIRPLLRVYRTNG